MRVLVLSTRVTEHERGDPPPQSLVVRALLDLGHEVHLVCGASEPLRSADQLTVWPVHPDRSGGLPAFSARALDAAKRCEPDAVIAEQGHLALGWAVATRSRAALVPMIDEPAGDEDDWRLSLRAALAGPLVRGAAACICFGPGGADRARQGGATRVIELPGVSSIEGAHPARTDWLRRHMGAEDQVIALSWGSLSPEHGTDALIEGVKVAADADTEVHAAIFGGDETSIARYEAKAQRLGIDQRVHLLGTWPAARLAALLTEADILVEPSTDAGLTPPALFTFLASGRPVVLAEREGRDRLVAPGVCALTPGDRLGIGHELAELAADAELRSRLAASANDFVAKRHVYTCLRLAMESLEAVVRVGTNAV